MESLVKMNKTDMRKRLIFLIPVLFVLLMLILLKFVFFIGYVPSASMEPTLKENSLIIGCRIYKNISVGDIVIFEYNGNLLVKRIAAGGGETIEVEGTEYCVPQDHYFMLGDNRDNSFDSRFWENPFISAEDIIAKLF